MNLYHRIDAAALFIKNCIVKSIHHVKTLTARFCLPMIFVSLCSVYCINVNAKTTIVSGACSLQREQWYIQLNSMVTLGAEPIKALKNGITLYFAYEIEFYNGWFGDNKRITHQLRLRYNHISQSYVLTDPITLAEQQFPTINSALAAMGSVDRLPLITAQLLTPDVDYRIRARFTLQSDKLPVSLRLTALINDDWDVNSAWWYCAP